MRLLRPPITIVFHRGEIVQTLMRTGFVVKTSIFFQFVTDIMQFSSPVILPVKLVLYSAMSTFNG
jgi:hypothetical protein